MPGDFVRGLTAPARALKLLASERRLRRLALIPLAVNVVLFVVGIPLVAWMAVALIGAMVPDAGVLEGALRLILQVVAIVAVVVGSLFMFVAVGNIVASPFNSKLSMAIEELRTGRPAVSDAGIVTGATRSILTAIGRLVIFLLFYPPILATQLIPGAGFIIYPFLTTLYGAFVLSLDFSDPTFERHLSRFRDKVRFIRQRKMLYLGFGLAAVGMTLIPFLNLLLLPVGVAAAALLYLEAGERPAR